MLMFDALKAPFILIRFFALSVDRRARLILLMAMVLLINSAPSIASEKCQISNPALEAMPPVRVLIIRSDGSEHSITAKLADTNHTRAAGFQRVCASTIRKTPILFVFENEVVPSFHMNNVVAPIDIAFIKKNGSIDVIHQMQPYSLISLSKPLYASKTPILAALETYKGFFDDHSIGLDSTVSWSALENEETEISSPKPQ